MTRVSNESYVKYLEVLLEFLNRRSTFLADYAFLLSLKWLKCFIFIVLFNRKVKRPTLMLKKLTKLLKSLKERREKNRKRRRRRSKVPRQKRRKLHQPKRMANLSKKKQVSTFSTRLYSCMWWCHFESEL